MRYAFQCKCITEVTTDYFNLVVCDSFDLSFGSNRNLILTELNNCLLFVLDLLVEFFFKLLQLIF